MSTPDAVATMYRTHRDRVHRFLMSRCHDRDLADDLTAETFECVVVALGRGATPDAEVPWLLGIAHHKLLDAWRRQHREQQNMERIVVERVRASSAVVDHHCSAALARLTPEHREALQLRYVEGMPVVDVARTIARSVHATESLLARARRSLRENIATERAISTRLLLQEARTGGIG